jgi:hypothetical protein
LTSIARKGTEKTRPAAVRAYLKLAEAAKEPTAALAIYHQGLRLASDDNERRLALSGIANIASPDSLPILRHFLNEEGVRAEAAAAVVPIAEKLAQTDRKQEAIELLQQAVRLCREPGMIRRAASGLRSLGARPDIASIAGAVTNWWVLGPFPGREALGKKDAISTDGFIDLKQAVAHGERSLRWKYAPADDPMGMLDLEQAVARQDDCGAYVYAELTSPSARDILLLIGSDDDVVVWLNGKQVHSFRGDRGFTPDQDRVQTRLEAGKNALLLKVLNGGGQWACGVRITDRDGTPLVLEQRSE